MNVKEIVVSTLIPISRAACGSWAVARMARPMRERLMKLTSRTTSGAVTSSASRSPWVTGTPRIVNAMSWDPIRSGTPRCDPPSHSRPMFCRMKEKPIAVINGASFGAFRNGL